MSEHPAVRCASRGVCHRFLRTQVESEQRQAATGVSQGLSVSAVNFIQRDSELGDVCARFGYRLRVFQIGNGADSHA